MPINVKTFTPLSVQTFEGVPDGMNLALPGQEIQDTEAIYLQDILLDYPGLVRRRGPVQAAAGFPTFSTYKTSGITSALDPSGNTRLAVMRGDNSSAFASLLSSDFSTVATDFSWPGALPTAPTANPYRIVDSKAGLNKGTWIGTSSSYVSNGPVQNLGLWIGANKADYSTGTVTVARGATAVTGSGTSWSANVVPGMFMFVTTDDSYTLTYNGIVTAVNSDTSITLGDVSLYPATAKAYKFTSIRGFCPRVVKGRLTTATGSTTVTGANTKFKSQNMGTGTWNMYRASDLTWIGKVSSVSNDFSITLAANAAIALNNERYIAVRADGDWNISTQSSTQKVGFLNATYAGFQWYGNNGQSYNLTSRVYFSDPSDAEAVDMDAFAGDFINISSTTGVNAPLKALCPAYNALLCFKDNEVFGVFGTSSTSFSVKKVEDDGAFSGMSVQPYGGGVIWAGRQGIHYYNGIQATNITQPKLGDFYKNMIRSINPDTYRMWSMVARDHYFLHIEFVQPSVPVIKGSTSTTPTNMTIVVNMISQSVTVWTNTGIRGSVVMPINSGYESLYVVNDINKGYIASSRDLFDVDGVNDTITCDSTTTNVWTNLVPNGGFEVDTTDWVNGGSGGALTMTRDTGAAKYGSASLKLVDTNAGADDYAYIEVACNPNTTYTLSAWMNCTAFTAGAYSNRSVALYDESSGDFLELDDLTGTTSGWVQKMITHTTHSVATNLLIRLYAPKGTVYWDGVQLETGSVAHPYVDTSGTTAQGVQAPDFYFESKKFSEGDSMHKKLFKQLSMNYLCQGDQLNLDTVLGLNQIGATSTSSFAPTVYTWDNLTTVFGNWDNLKNNIPTWDQLILSVFTPYRIKFLKRTQNLSFRIWQNSSSVTRARIGPFQVGYKWMRTGRV